MNARNAFQDLIPNNNCFGCGPHNRKGLRIKSHWIGENEAECRFTPSTEHSAGPLHTLNGGIIATLIDCHTVCTAIAKAYQMAGRGIGSGEPIWFATGRLTVSYQKPVPLDAEVVLLATIAEAKEKKIRVSCSVMARGEVCATGDVVAVRVPSGWFEGTHVGRAD